MGFGAAEKGGPYKERSGEYTKDWSYKRRGGEYGYGRSEVYSVYNQKHYRLTHLLEKGHVGRDGRRVKAFEHIAPVNDMTEVMVTANVTKAVEAANGGI